MALHFLEVPRVVMDKAIQENGDGHPCLTHRGMLIIHPWDSEMKETIQYFNNYKVPTPYRSNIRYVGRHWESQKWKLSPQEGEMVVCFHRCRHRWDIIIRYLLIGKGTLRIEANDSIQNGITIKRQGEKLGLCWHFSYVSGKNLKVIDIINQYHVMDIKERTAWFALHTL